MKQATLVSLYGQKDNSLSKLLATCVERIQASPLRRVFKPYHLNQVHGTLVGLEKLIGYSNAFNANEWTTSKRKVVMEFEPLLELIHKNFPMSIRFGGFTKVFSQFHSFGHSPYERSFQVQHSIYP